mmetsp:Transcript_31572/g.41722  ORF Transcript_31572/g.41722 Transcript_31572/m.41722 type:complete len:714 (-) Transcript_31572:684-2825(-)
MDLSNDDQSKVEAISDFNLSDKEFFSRYKYGWDLAIVFPGEEASLQLVKEKIQAIQAAGLHTFSYYSTASDTKSQNILCKVRAPRERLEHFADFTNRKFLLNDSEAKRRMEQGNEKHKLNGKTIPDDPDFSKYPAYQYIYGKYDTHEDLQRLYVPQVKDPLEPYLDHPFRQTLRLQLMIGILQAPANAGGAAFNVRGLLDKKEILGFFPLHNEAAIEFLKKEWLPMKILPWNLPLTHIKNYFGEAIGLYFAFLGHYSTWLMPCSIVGFVLGISSYGLGYIDAVPVAAFGIFISLWGILMLEFWKRKEATLALEWGMCGIEEEQLERPEFKGEYKQSPINGGQILHFPSSKKKSLVCNSFAVILILIILVIGCLAAIILFRIISENADENDWKYTYGKYLASAMNAIQIQVLNLLYKEVAVKLNNRENHRTDIEYQDSMISKLFLFQAVNSYSSFVYLAFIQEPVTGECSTDGSSCMYLLMINLVVIFGLQLVQGNIQEVFLPYFQYKRKSKHLESQEITQAENEFYKEEYDEIMGTLLDYAEIAIQFGFMTLFVSAMPFTPLFGLINNWVEIRSDGWKLLQVMQRPQPVPAQDIGTWMVIFQLMTILAVISNCALICFVMENVFDEDIMLSTRLWIFVIFQYFLFMVMFLAQLLVRDVPADVTNQLSRTNYIVSRLVDLIADEDEDAFELLKQLPEVEIKESEDAPVQPVVQV